MRKRDIAIALWLAVQLSVPLSYYLDYSETKSQFGAWRMFSEVHMSLSRVDWWQYRAGEVDEGSAGASIDLTKHLAYRWRKRLPLGPRWLFERVALHLCHETGAAAVSFRWTMASWGDAGVRTVDEGYFRCGK